MQPGFFKGKSQTADQNKRKSGLGSSSRTKYNLKQTNLNSTFQGEEISYDEELVERLKTSQ